MPALWWQYQLYSIVCCMQIRCAKVHMHELLVQGMPWNHTHPTNHYIIMPMMLNTKHCIELFNWKSPFSKNIPAMTTFSKDIKSSIILYNFTSSSFCLSMTRSGSISSKPGLCGCAQVVSCADSLLYSPAHWQPRRAYGQRTSLKCTHQHPQQQSQLSRSRSVARERQHQDGMGQGRIAAGMPSLAALWPHIH